MSNGVSGFDLTRSAAASAIFISASFVNSSAFADCATSGSGPVTLTCSGTFATTNTGNSTTPNADTVDRTQTFSDSVNDTVNSGAVLTGAGLQVSSVLSGSSVSLTNNGSITGNANAAVGIAGLGSPNSTALSYSGSGSITGSGIGVGALLLGGAGLGTTTATISGTSVIKSQASGGVFNAFGIDTTGTSGTVNVTVLNGGVVQGSNAIQFDGTGSNTLTNSGIVGTNFATTAATVATNGVSANVVNNNSITVVNHGTGVISGSNTGIIAGSGGSVAITNDLGGSITGTNTTLAMGATAASVGIAAGSVTGSNAGTISGSTHGIDTTGSLPGGGHGSSVNLTTNSGTIQGTAAVPSGFMVGSGIRAWTSATIGTNSGTISGGLDGITSVNSFVTVNKNTGTISGLSGNGITAATTATVTNASTGQITGAAAGIQGASVSVTNSGTVSASTGSGVAASTGVLSVTNNTGGTISGSIGVNSDGTSATIINGGAITGTTVVPSGSGIKIFGGTSNITNNSGGTISGSQGISSTSGLAMTLSNAGTVSGSSAGISATGDVNVVANSGTISGASSITTTAGANITNNSGGQITASAGGAGINAQTIMLSNAGTISGGSGGALNSNGSVTVTSNSGTITSTNAAFGTISGFGPVSVTNGTTGTISATGAFSLAISASGAPITLANSGSVTASGSGAVGIFASGATATVANSGSITATGTNTIGIAGNGMTITNNAGATISGSLDGINQQASTTTTVANAGTISGAGRSGARLGSNASVVNTGTITGATGIAFRDPTGMGVAVNNGSVFNSGIITGTGGTAINFNLTAGSGPFTLTLGPGSIINGNVLGTGGDLFQLGGASGTDTFNVSNIGASQQYQGFTTFNKIGGSTWLLTGTGAQTWTISGGLLGGTATVGGINVQSGGTLMPGNGTAGSSMSVTGNLAFQSGAQYLVQLNSTTSSLAKVTGNATLGGATVDANFSSNTVSKTYTILTTSTGNVSGTFNPVVTTNLPSNFSTSLSYDAHDVFLNVSMSLAGGANLNGNQQNVANVLTNFFNTNGSLPAAFAMLTPAGFTQITGEAATGSQQTTFDAMTQFMGLLTDPFIVGRGDPLTPSGRALPYAEEDGDASAYAAKGSPRTASERDAYAAIYRKAPPADQFAQRWSVWASGFGGSQTTDGNTLLGTNNTTSRIAGAAVGADYRLSPFTLAGFALAGGGTSFSVVNGGTGRSDLFQMGAFIHHAVGPAYISGALAYGWQDVTTDRILTVSGIDRLRAEFNANAFSGRAEAGYRFVQPWTAGIGITPYAAAQFVTFDLPAYAEQALSGANTFAQSYAARDATDTRSELGIRTDKSYVMADGILTLRGRFAWAHDFNPDRNVLATFQALPGASFVVNGAAQASDSALVTASAEKRWINGWSAAATFEGEFSNVTRSYAGKGVVRYSW